MVKILTFLLLFSSIFLVGEEIKVAAEVEGSKIYENTPIKVLVTISHAPQEMIDLSSFKLEGKKIKAEPVKEEKMTATGNLQLSMFHIEIPPMKKGLQLIPEIEVLVNGQTYRSVPSTFMVLGEAQEGESKPSDKPGEPMLKSGEPMLKLEAFVDGPKLLLPGQKTIVGYRYLYNTNLETTVEEIPLLDAQGLVKVGDKIAQEEEKEGLTTLKLVQIVKGEKPGEYTYGPSTLEGIPYRLNADGSRAYANQKISSTAPPVTIKVIPYPDVDKPTSFNGALGDFQWKVSLISSPSLNVGDELLLSVDVTGKGDWDTVTLPELCCQPGMSGLFRLEDFPSVGKLSGQKKTFEVKLRPLSTSVTEIPSLEFSSLDPDTLKYNVGHSTPIPIHVEMSKIVPEMFPATKSVQDSTQESWQEHLKETSPLEISGNEPLEPSDLYNYYFGSWWVLFIIPLGMGLLIFQYNWKLFRSKHLLDSEAQKLESVALFENAVDAPKGSSLQFDLLRKAIFMRLVEKGEIPGGEFNEESLSTTGLQGEVRQLLHQIDKKRYTSQSTLSDDELLLNARVLFEKMEELDNGRK